MRISWAVLAILSAFLYFHRLGDGCLRLWDESLTAQRSAEIGGSNGWLHASLSSAIDLNKPPLYYWITSGIYRLFGKSEGSVRMASAFFGMCCVWLVMFHGWRLGGSNAGFWAGCFLLLNGHWMNLTRQGLLDSGFLLGGLGAIAFLSGSIPGVWRGIAAGCCLAFGSMIKNPGIVLALAIPLMDWTLVRKAPIPKKALASCLLVWLSLGLPWYLAEFCLNREAFIRTFVMHNLKDRFLVGIHLTGTCSFYPSKWLLFAPLSLLLFAFSSQHALPKKREFSPASPWILFPLCLLALLTACPSKRIAYLLLIYPFLAVAASYAFDTLLKKTTPARRICIILPLLFALLWNFHQEYRKGVNTFSVLKKAALTVKGVAVKEDCIVTLLSYGGIFPFYTDLDAFTFGRKTENTFDNLVAKKQNIFLVIMSRDGKTQRKIDRLNRKWHFLKKPPLFENEFYTIYRITPQEKANPTASAHGRRAPRTSRGIRTA